MLGLAGLCTGQDRGTPRVLRIPYTLGGRTEMSNAYLTVPFVRIGSSWTAFSRSKQTGAEEFALQQLLAGVYAGDRAVAAQRIRRVRELANQQKFDEYVQGFKASLAKAGEMDIEGYFLLPGRVRFVLKPQDPVRPYRLLTFRSEAGGPLMFDETQTNNKVDSALNSVFLNMRGLRLEVPEAPRAGTVTVTAEAAQPPAPAVKLTVKADLIDQDTDRKFTAFGPALEFYRRCYTIENEAQIGNFFSCFDPGTQAKIRAEYQKMTADHRTAFVAVTASVRHVEFAVQNPASTFIYYSLKSQPVSHRDIVVGAPAGPQYLENPMVSFPLDDLLTQLRSGIYAALKK